jgi:hypothetical protein
MDFALANEHSAPKLALDKKKKQSFSYYFGLVMLQK